MNMQHFSVKFLDIQVDPVQFKPRGKPQFMENGFSYISTVFSVNTDPGLVALSSCSILLYAWLLGRF